jgi:hypothetical protein
MNGQVTLQNWGEGNDNVFRYLFLPIETARSQIDDWYGGIDLETLRISEVLSTGWHYAFKNMSDYNLWLDGSVLGTCTNLAKMPYLRDTRRSIGVDGFILQIEDLSSNVSLVGTPFDDRIAIGVYDIDIHPLLPSVCTYPANVFQSYPVRPFFIPYRALTHYQLTNFLVAGKSIAQSFLANAPTRVHPVEWSIGVGAGASAAFMVQNGIYNAHKLVNNTALINELQNLIRTVAPLEWTINGSLYPPNY